MRTRRRRRTAAPGRRRPAALLALLWLIIAVIAHHELPGPLPATAPVQSVLTASGHAQSGRTPSGHTRLGHAQPGDAQSDQARPGRSQGVRAGHLHDSGAACPSGAHCSSYDVRSEHFVAPPPLLGTARAAHATAPSAPGPRPTGGPSPPDPAALSVLRI
ncbi:hypothetical protein ACFXO2_28890 [Streptomyces sp. NPDC059152]|uniref:hypothetical protein n=1 Tax=Streptomyces sp. NPDC059152 TaxID=3346742 RepID=UPI0036745250